MPTQKSAKITVRSLKRMTPEDVTEMARNVVTRQGMLAWREDEIRSAFYMMTMLMPPFSEAAAKLVGGFYGDLKDTVPGRAMNGYPIFYACRLVRRDDLVLVDAEIGRMQELLGMRGS